MKDQTPDMSDATAVPAPFGSRPEDSNRSRQREELTRMALSGESARLRDGLGVPIRLLPLPREGTRAALQEYNLSLNRLISGQVSNPRVWAFVEEHLPEGAAAEFESLFRIHFDPLWSREEALGMRARGAADLHEEWLRRAEAADAWAGAFSALRRDRDFASLWGELTVGDFDIGGRGKDYTVGMEYFQAARSFGIESLLELFGPLTGRSGLFLDVLGGDGYILRILEAGRKLREKHLLVTRADATGPDSADVPEEVLREIRDRVDGLLVLTLSEPDGEGNLGARLWGIGARSVVGGEPFAMSVHGLLELIGERSVAWLGDRPPATGLGPVLESARTYLAERGRDRHRPMLVTNDLSPHMFLSAGTWGFATREDARSLSRTFRAGSLDGVVFAYGTHHVLGLEEAICESLAVLRPGGRILVHDFHDEGQVGRWFHEVVHPFSRTGHDFLHYGPVRKAVGLLMAGFRDIELYEMSDPFVFSMPEGSDADARDVACTYLLGMYGMTEKLGGRRDRFEALVSEFLTYPEIGDVPRFDRDLVYIPRRATVACAIRPPYGVEDGLSGADAELATLLGELLTAEPASLMERLRPEPEVAASWFPPDGSRWGVSPALARRYLGWLERARRG